MTGYEISPNTIELIKQKRARSLAIDPVDVLHSSCGVLNQFRSFTWLVTFVNIYDIY